MKKTAVLLIFLFFSALVSISFGQTYSISGNVRYYYDWDPIDSCRVFLKDSTQTKIASTTVSNTTAAYSFSNLAPGTYYVGIDSCWTKYWGGSNSLDAWLIGQHFTGQITLTGLPLLAADVTNDSYVNMNDALMVQQRFVHMISSFPAGNWVLNDDNQVVIISCNQTQYIETTCFGDLNHTANPY